MEVLKEHPVILKEPEPTVLVAAISDASVTLRVYFWINGRENSWLKGALSVMRLVLHAIDRQEEPASSPLQNAAASHARTSVKNRSTARSQHDQSASAKVDTVATKGEGDLAAEAEEIKGQVDAARCNEGENLLTPEPHHGNGAMSHAE